MNFNDKYPRLFQFLVGYFSDYDFEDLTDEQIVLNYINDCNKSEISKKDLEAVKKDIDDLIIKIDDYWEVLSIESNIYFKNSEEALNWINRIKNLLNYPKHD